MFITQEEANYLISLPKQFKNVTLLEFGNVINQHHELISNGNSEKFILDIWRSGLRLSKFTYNNRGRNSISLVRVDIGGGNHLNPDGGKVLCPHIHIYKEGYWDKWAEPLSKYKEFCDYVDLLKVYEGFTTFCNIKRIPIQPSYV